MSRDFDGTNDSISFGSDASIDDFTQKSVLCWIDPDDSANATDDLVAKSDGAALTPTGWQFSRVEVIAVSTGHLQFTQDFSAADGTWSTPNNGVPEDALRHVAVTYDRGDTANDPNIYIDGSLVAEVETGAPLGASQADAAQNLRVGEDDGGGNDYDGGMAFLVYDSTLFTAADVNRHKWWGVAPGGPSTVDVWQPMWTDDLVNKGTATANGTATGTTTVSLPRVERCWAGTMGVGR